jgi:hypothetical protein
MFYEKPIALPTLLFPPSPSDAPLFSLSTFKLHWFMRFGCAYRLHFIDIYWEAIALNDEKGSACAKSASGRRSRFALEPPPPASEKPIVSHPYSAPLPREWENGARSRIYLENAALTRRLRCAAARNQTPDWARAEKQKLFWPADTKCFCCFFLICSPTLALKCTLQAPCCLARIVLQN